MGQAIMEATWSACCLAVEMGMSKWHKWQLCCQLWWRNQNHHHPTMTCQWKRIQAGKSSQGGKPHWADQVPLQVEGDQLGLNGDSYLKRVWRCFPPVIKNFRAKENCLGVGGKGVAPGIPPLHRGRQPTTGLMMRKVVFRDEDCFKNINEVKCKIMSVISNN